MGGEHLINENETRNIAEGFLAASPWFGDVEWDRFLVGPNVEFLTEGFTERVRDDVELSEGQRWTWMVSFTDPAGTTRSLTHETVLKGITRLVYNENTSADAFLAWPVGQWFREPADVRRSLKLSSAQQSLICQEGLYERKVFPVDEAAGVFSPMDFFADQRTDSSIAES